MNALRDSEAVASTAGLLPCPTNAAPSGSCADIVTWEPKKELSLASTKDCRQERWADGFRYTIRRLLPKRINVLVMPIPVTSLSDVVAAFEIAKLIQEAREKVDPEGDRRRAPRETPPEGLCHFG
jgi:hypothetical protein